MVMTIRRTPAKLEAAEAALAAAPLSTSEGAWAQEARAAARARLMEVGGMPTRRDEYYRYTDPKALINAPVQPVSELMAEDDKFFPSANALEIIFTDGVLTTDIATLEAIEGVEIVSLADAMSADIHWAKDLYGVLEARGQSPVERPLAALNSAIATQGVAIRVSAKAERAVHLRYLNAVNDADAFVHNIVSVAEGASFTLLESGPVAARANTVLEVEVPDLASFDHVRLQGRAAERQIAAYAYARIGKEAGFRSFTLTANGALTRNETVIEMLGDDSIAHVAGACMGDGKFLHDDTVFVTHDSERCESRQVFKKVLSNGAKGVFQGKILVKEGAQKTDGYQLSQGLLMDERSELNAKPELEIYADDVACSHGSTCGAVDETALYYLRSRGVPKRAAQNMLVQAFLAQTVEEINDEDLAADVLALIEGWLEAHA